MKQSTKDEIKRMCLDALETDGAHHKQWYIERILEKLGYNLETLIDEEAAEGYEWEEGIAP